MSRRALLIGSETYGLTGCNGDVELMAGVLAGWGFDAISTLVDGAATRAAIVAALERLVADTRPDDAVLVYYSGHGGRVVRPDEEQRRAAGLSPHFQFVVPFDMEASEPGDFRGLLAEEITRFQRRLTDVFLAHRVTPNLTTVLDCCHSGYLARAAGTTQKSVDLTERMFRMRGIREHAQQLGAAAETELGATNPHAVRIVACQPEQSAFELTSRTEGRVGERHGALTDALASVLAELGAQRVAWSVVGDLVRRRVRAIVPEQRPDVEGPASRLLFSTGSARDKGALAVSVIAGSSVIEAAGLLDIRAGDEFRLVLPGRDEEIGTAVVARIDGGSAVLSVAVAGAPAGRAGTEGAAAMPAGCQAVRAAARQPRSPVAVDVDGATGDELRQAVGRSIRVRLAASGEQPIATVVDRDGLVVLDPLGARWRVDARPTDLDGLDATVDELEQVAAGRRLLELPSGTGDSALDALVDVSFGVLRDGARRDLARHGARVRAGEPVTLVVRNASAQRLFGWIFDVGVSGRAAMLTVEASGTLLGPAGSADDRITVWPRGQALFWPADVPYEPGSATRDAARAETFVIVLADQRGDLSSLAPRRGVVRGGPPPADLESMFTGPVARSRDGDVAPAPALRYRVEEVSFFLDRT